MVAKLLRTNSKYSLWVVLGMGVMALFILGQFGPAPAIGMTAAFLPLAGEECQLAETRIETDMNPTGGPPGPGDGHSSSGNTCHQGCDPPTEACDPQTETFGNGDTKKRCKCADGTQAKCHLVGTDPNGAPGITYGCEGACTDPPPVPTDCTDANKTDYGHSAWHDILDGTGAVIGRNRTYLRRCVCP